MIRILFLGANPSDTTRLALDKEIREITGHLRATPREGSFDLRQESALRASDVQAALLRHEPHIVHFSGHGMRGGASRAPAAPGSRVRDVEQAGEGVASAGNGGGIFVEDDAGHAAPIGADALADLFRILRGRMRCVVLNACFSEPQAEAIARHVDCVVGMRRAIDDASAIAFAWSFYQALGFGRSIEEAFDLGRNQVRLAGLADADVPKLLLRDGVDPARLHVTPAARAGPARPGAALHQLRAPPADFTGRERELADLRARLGSGGVIVAGLTGQGGVGKTALALELARGLQADYPDAQFDIDLQGTRAEPRTPAQVMAEVIRSFDPTAEPPEDVEALGRLYRSMLHGKRALLLLDNARDRAQVEPLLPPPGCLLLVTSRAFFTLPGLHAERLAMLEREEAADLLQRIAPRLDAAAAAELAKLCGYLPLALRTAARTLAERVDLKVDRYLQRLRLAQNRQQLVDAVLTESSSLLDAPARALWLRLGVLSGSFDVEIAAAVAGMDADATADLLGDLVRSSLLEWDGASERYRQHDLARDYARSRLDPEERSAAERRHAEHVLRIARSADDLRRRGDVPLADVLGHLVRHWENIRAVLDWAATQWDRDEVAARFCCDLLMLLPEPLRIQQPPAEQIPWYEAGIAAARRLGRHLDESHLLAALGHAESFLGDSPKALEAFERQLGLTRTLGDRESERQALRNIAHLYDSAGEWRSAVERHRELLEVARGLGDLVAEEETLGGLGQAYARVGETGNAIACYEQILAIARRRGSAGDEAMASLRLARAYEQIGDGLRASAAMQVYEAYEGAVDQSIRAGPHV